MSGCLWNIPPVLIPRNQLSNAGPADTDHLVEVAGTACLGWLQQNREQLEEFADAPLAFSGVAAAALYDLDFSRTRRR